MRSPGAGIRRRHRGSLGSCPTSNCTNMKRCCTADPDAFAVSFDECDGAIAGLKRIVAEFHEDIERINDSELTAPSKRIIGLLEALQGDEADCRAGYCRIYRAGRTATALSPL